MQPIQAPGLALSQGQKMTLGLRLAPQMRVMMQYLAMPVLELREEIKKKLEANPALEESDSAEILFSQIERSYKNDEVSADWDEEASDRHQKFMENLAAPGESLHAHLLVQLGMQKNVDEKVVNVARLLVQNLNTDGFLELAPQEAVPDADSETLQNAVLLVQMMDPQGTCVRDYKESLSVQASLRDDAPEYADKVIT
ncbi:MAG: hypothetical protein IJQ27_04540, partial [Spirochaetia bacterium]|nr:hypothetical protein [Spirochaetia bacterium]